MPCRPHSALPLVAGSVLAREDGLARVQLGGEGSRRRDPAPSRRHHRAPRSRAGRAVPATAWSFGSRSPSSPSNQSKEEEVRTLPVGDGAPRAAAAAPDRSSLSARRCRSSRPELALRAPSPELPAELAFPALHPTLPP
ncbi:unnamed protein product [Urochloa humidicola]